jgi:hypothetical protein
MKNDKVGTLCACLCTQVFFEIENSGMTGEELKVAGN